MPDVIVKLLPLADTCRTRIWFSDRALDELLTFKRKGDPDGRFLKSLKRASESGFSTLEDSVPPKLKLEWDGVSRIGFDFSKFRLIGFYEDPKTKSDYIVIATLMKRGQKLDSTDRATIDQVASIKSARLWRKEKPQ